MICAIKVDGYEARGFHFNKVHIIHIFCLNKVKKSRVEMTNFVWQSSIGTVHVIVILVKELRKSFLSAVYVVFYIT